MAYEPTLTPHVREPNAFTLDFYTRRGRGYEALKKALTQQPAIASEAPAACPEAERAAVEVCSLPLYPSLSTEAVDAVCAAVQSFRG